MLSPNTLLNKGRYLVDSLIRSMPEWALYSAHDQASSELVLCVEYAEQSRGPVDVSHDGLMTMADSFVMNGRRIWVTEAVSNSSSHQSVRSIWDRFAVLLMGLNTFAATSRDTLEISPDTLTRAKDGRIKLLPLLASSAISDLEAWHVPLEVLWQDLDHISQKAIYNAWNETAVEALELPADHASSIYSLAAIFYRELTGHAPVCAFERTLTELDGADPLQDPAALVPELGSEASSFLMRCLALRREVRFPSFEEAVMNFPSLPEQTESPKEEELEPLRVPAATAPVRRSDTFAPVVEPLGSLLEIPGIDLVSRDATEQLPPASAIAVERTAEPTSETNAPVPVFTPAAPRSVDDAAIFSAGAEAPGGRSFLGKLVFVAVALAGLGGGGWAFYNYSSPIKAEKREAPVAAMIVPTPEPSPSPFESTPASIEIGTASTPTDVSGVSAGPDPSNASSGPKTSRSTPKTAPPTKTATAAPQIAKKKVTVDDLINDN